MVRILAALGGAAIPLVIALAAQGGSPPWERANPIAPVPHFFWDGRAASIEEQALGPVGKRGTGRIRQGYDSGEFIGYEIVLRALSSAARQQYDTARRFLAQAKSALKIRNYVFARNLADKAGTLAHQLGK